MAESPAWAEGRNLPSLTSLRWYAAVLVVVYHFGQVGRWTALNPFQWGYTGVAFFFVLSGFVLTWSNRPKKGAGAFLWRRFARIYPSHLAMFLVAAAAARTHIANLATGTGDAVLQITLLHAWPLHITVVGYNGPSWSLSAEAFFYALFPILVPLFVRHARLMDWVTGAALAVGLVIAIIASRNGLRWANSAYYNPITRLPEFMLGIWLASRIKSWRPLRFPVWTAVLILAPLALVTWRVLLPYFPATDYALLPGFAAVIAAGAIGDQTCSAEAIGRVLRHRWSVYLGEVSFCLYLVHWVILYAFVNAGRIRPGTSSGSQAEAFLAFFMSSLAAAVVLHHAVEIPAQRWLTSGIPLRSRWPERDDKMPDGLV